MASLPRNNHELRRVLREPFTQAVELTMQKIWNANRDAIRRIVYGVAQPSTYERTNEFKDDAWSYEQSKSPSTTTFIEFEFFYDWAKLNVNRNMAQHGSPIYLENYQDVRPYLADIIYGGLSGDLFGDGYWRRARDAWSELLHIMGKRNLSMWFKECCQRVGLDMTHRMNVAFESWDEK